MMNNENYIILSKSSYFDADYYLSTYPEVKSINIDPIIHYLESGWKKGYNPSPLFDNNAYLKMYNDVDNAGINPLIHYLRNGFKEGREIKKVAESCKASDSNEMFRQNMPENVYKIYKELVKDN